VDSPRICKKTGDARWSNSIHRPSARTGPPCTPGSRDWPSRADTGMT
jgi:hypothetical protein